LLNVVNYAVDFIFLRCFDCCVAYRTCEHCSNSFWVIGGSKLGFWMKKGWEFVNF